MRNPLSRLEPASCLPRVANPNACEGSNRSSQNQHTSVLILADNANAVTPTPVARDRSAGESGRCRDSREAHRCHSCPLRAPSPHERPWSRPYPSFFQPAAKPVRLDREHYGWQSTYPSVRSYCLGFLADARRVLTVPCGESPGGELPMGKASPGPKRAQSETNLRECDRLHAVYRGAARAHSG
jgi:hypothetical protein